MTCADETRQRSEAHCCCSYAISRFDRCEGLLQEWDNYVQSAAVTARAMDEVR